MRLTSAHALGGIAIVVAVGGGIATAQPSPSTPGPAIVHKSIAKAVKITSTSERLITQVEVKAKTSYAVSAKVVVARPATGTTSGTVTCHLGGLAGANDDARVSLSLGKAATLALQIAGLERDSTVATAALDLSCGSTGGGYTVSNVRITAVPVASVTVG